MSPNVNATNSALWSNYQTDETGKMGRFATDDNHRLALVDGLRCFAALWVVFFHLSEGHHIPSLLAAIPQWLRYVVFDAGHMGVPIFFVLSGFVMAVTTSFIPMTTNNATNFVARRLIRLAPPYYAAVAFGVVVLAVKHFSGEDGNEIPSTHNILVHFLFLQGFLGTGQISLVFWTLCIEVQFYITFALLLWLAEKVGERKNFHNRNIAIWASASLALLWPMGLVDSIGWKGGFIAFWFSFMAGVLCAQNLSGTKKSRYIACGYCGLIFIIGIVSKNSFAITAGLTGLSFCFLWNSSKTIDLFSSYPVQKIALISYSLYLFHSPVTGTFMRIFRHFMPTGIASDLVGTIFAVSVCILFAFIIYILVERPAIAWSKRIKFRRVTNLS